MANRVTSAHGGAVTRPGRRRVRSLLAAVTGVLAVLILTATLISVWAAATVLRPEPVGELAADALADAEVQAGLAARVAGEVAGAIDLEAVVARLLLWPRRW